MEIYFEIIGCLGRKIRVTKNHWKLIAYRKHPEIARLEHEVQMALAQAEVVRISQDDPEVFLYYKRHGKYYLCVVCRHLNGEGFIVTCYLTDKAKEGRQVWQR